MLKSLSIFDNNQFSSSGESRRQNCMLHISYSSSSIKNNRFGLNEFSEWINRDMDDDFYQVTYFSCGGRRRSSLCVF